jgi:DUF4097 and DUF4098 domain-containing protein YvlB
VSEAHVVVSLKSDNMERAVDMFERMNFVVEMVGDEVRVVSEPLQRLANFNWNGNFSIDVDVTIPERFNASLNTTHGDVELDDIEGDVRLNTTHGDVSVGTIAGPVISLRSTHGDIEGISLASEIVEVATTHADIEFDTVSSKDFSAKTSHSDVQIRHLSGSSDIETSHGAIEISMDGAYPANLTTSHGNVYVQVPTSANADLDLQGAQVNVASAFAIKGSVSKENVSGSLNGGGAKIRARTTHGSVNIKNQ